MTEIRRNDIFKLIDLYFNEEFVMYKYLYDGFSQFIDEIIVKELKENQNLISFSEDKVNNIIYKYKFEFDNIKLQAPINEKNNKELYPGVARIDQLTYCAKLLVDVKQVQEIINFNNNTIEKKVIAEEKAVPLCKIPIMLRSKYCATNLYKDKKNTECIFDPGCYFIVKGSEKVVLALERICENKILVYSKKDPSYKKGITYTVTVNSKTPNINSSVQKSVLRIKKDDSIILSTTQFGDIPVGVMFRALGIDTDEKICNLVVHDMNNELMIHLFEKSLMDASEQEITIQDVDKNGAMIEKKVKVTNQETAIKYLVSKLKNTKRYTSNNIFLFNDKKTIHIYNIIANDFLPHMGTVNVDNINFNMDEYAKKFPYKAYFLGLMVNKLLQCMLGKEPDDRDSYLNKRIDFSGILLGQLFRQFYRKMLLDCQRIYKKKNTDNTNPVSIINYIKSITIEQGINNALATGTWGSTKKKGVAQMMQRLTYLFSISYLRRITIAPDISAFNSKVVSIRRANNNQFGYMDISETPDGGSIGLIKHLSLTCSVSLYLDSQYKIINEYLRTVAKEYGISTLLEIHPREINGAVKLFLNGEWLGITKKPYELVEHLREKRFSGYIHKTVSIVLDYFNYEIRIYCDGGRMYRPLMTVKNYELTLTKKMLDSIDIKGTVVDKISLWNNFLLKYKNVIEYIDIEECEFTMIAMFVEDIYKSKKTCNTIIDNPNPVGDPINRYDDTIYKKYTHCELHPMLIFGVINSNIPFSDRNQAPRNYYHYMQKRQGMGIYATNHRYRIDIAYLLHYPQIPLVITRASYYTNYVHMPNGENVIVAIMSYTGMNQEDSLVVNKASLERGMFRASAFKKYMADLHKNTMTAQDDIFIKPDKNLTSGIKDSNYDKLQEDGHVEEGTVIDNGDVIIGKVSPIQQTAHSKKVFVDDSEVYRSNVPAVVDKNYLDLYNNEGYEMRIVKIRAERFVFQGDKLSSQHGQKGTTGVILDAADMPYTEEGIQPDIIINPHCIPSRMTIGQLFECPFSKAGALEGYIMDGTPFSGISIDEVKGILTKHGYKDDCTEYMYCGFTGKKIKSPIFIGPTYYMRLKHMVLDKIHSRARGPSNILTRRSGCLCRF